MDIYLILIYIIPIHRIPYFGNQNVWTISWTKALTSHESLGGLPHHLCRCWIWMHCSSQICSAEAVLHAQSYLVPIIGQGMARRIFQWNIVKSYKMINMDQKGKFFWRPYWQTRLNRIFYSTVMLHPIGIPFRTASEMWSPAPGPTMVAPRISWAEDLVPQNPNIRINTLRA